MLKGDIHRIQLIRLNKCCFTCGVMTPPVESVVTHPLCVGLQLLVYMLSQPHVRICVHESSLPPSLQHHWSPPLVTPCQ